MGKREDQGVRHPGAAGGGGSRVQAGVGEVCPRERERLSEGRWAGRWKPQ